MGFQLPAQRHWLCHALLQLLMQERAKVFDVLHIPEGLDAVGAVLTVVLNNIASQWLTTWTLNPVCSYACMLAGVLTSLASGLFWSKRLPQVCAPPLNVISRTYICSAWALNPDSLCIISVYTTNMPGTCRGQRITALQLGCIKFTPEALVLSPV